MHQKTNKQQLNIMSVSPIVKHVLLGAAMLILFADFSAGVITVQIGGATRLNSLTRSRDRYRCYWDCDLVGCQIARDDDECAYDCEKICRVKYDYDNAAAAAAGAAASAVAGRSDTTSGATGSQQQAYNSKLNDEMVGTGLSVRLHLPRNATARNFAIWERCAADSQTGKLTEKPFSL